MQKFDKVTIVQINGKEVAYLYISLWCRLRKKVEINGKVREITKKEISILGWVELDKKLVLATLK